MSREPNELLPDAVLTLQNTILFAVLIIGMALFGVIASSAAACSVAAMFLYVMLFDVTVAIGVRNGNRACTIAVHVLAFILYAVRVSRTPAMALALIGAVIALPALMVTIAMIIAPPWVRFTVLSVMIATHVYLRIRYIRLIKGDNK